MRTRPGPGDLALLFEHGSLGSLSDAQLVSIMADQPGSRLSSAAFEALVGRHGPMVWGTCRLLLTHRPDAEDAFQATFLVLAKRASVVRVGDSLGRWLHGVARKVCSRVREKSRGGAAGDGTDRPVGPDPSTFAESAELTRLLRDEVARLPAIYREVVTLCHLQGLSVDEAAARLGRPAGTIKGQLSRARDLLRHRLSRRGVAITLPAGLRQATARLAPGASSILSTSGLAAIGSGPVAVATLANGVVRSMLLLNRLMLSTLALALASGGALVARQTGSALPVAGQPASPAPAEPKTSPQAKPAFTGSVTGVVRDQNGKPVPHVEIVATTRSRELAFVNGRLNPILELNPLPPPTTFDGFAPEPSPARDRLSDSTSSEGRYQLSTADKSPFGVFASHKSGYARRSSDELAESADLVLEPWGRVEGTATYRGIPLPGVIVIMILNATDRHSMYYDHYQYRTTTDDLGRFGFDHVPAGLAMVATPGIPEPAEVPQAPLFAPLCAPITPIRAGETLQVDVGTSGRPVTGRFAVSGLPSLLVTNAWLQSLPLMPPAPDQGPDSPDDERFLTNFNHYRSADMHARRLGYRIYHGLLQNNDSFRFETVQPGTYLLTLHAGKADTVVATREVTIPPPDRQPDPSPIDLGTLGPSAP